MNDNRFTFEPSELKKHNAQKRAEEYQEKNHWETIMKKRLALANEMMILAAKVSPAMDLEEMDVILAEIALLREEHDALDLPAVDQSVSDRLELYKKLRIPMDKINIELNHIHLGKRGPFPFFLMKINPREVVSITFHEYPVAQKLVRNHFSCTNSAEYIVDDTVIDRWLDVEGFCWFHVNEHDVLPTPNNPCSQDI